MTILVLIGVLLLTVLVHEWGHFFSAKKFGMLVEEFGFGIPPRLWGKKRGETLYSINAIPFGGFVKIAGENGEEQGIARERQFDSKPWYARAIVLIAGVACNLLLAIILFTISYTAGTPTIDPSGIPTVLSIRKDSPAESAGLQVGDTITAIKKREDVLLKDSLTTSNIKKLVNNEESPIEIVVQKKNTTQTVIVIPEKMEGVIVLGLAIEPIGVEKFSFFEAFIQANKKTFSLTKDIFKTVGTLVGSLFSKKETGDLIGPIGLAQEVRHASQIGFSYLLAFTALISVNLAVLNILPFPALDGGRLVIVLLEQLFRKKFSKKLINALHTAGFLLLLLLMFVLSVGDIKSLL